jgi:hypothetical protein
VAGGWRTLHNEELQNLYASPNIIIRLINPRRMSWAGNVARMGEMKNAHKILGRKPEGKRPLGRPRRRWEDNIRMDRREVVWDGVDWVHLAQDREQWRDLVSTIMSLRIP